MEGAIMEIDDITYDIDNVDIESEMDMKDIEEEVEEIEAMVERQNEENVYKMAKVLNARNLDVDLSKLDESLRNRYRFKYHSVTYTGFVVYKFAMNVYIFDVVDEDSPKGNKMIKVNLNELKQIH